MSSSGAGGSSGDYGGVVRRGLKLKGSGPLKEIGAKTKKRKSSTDEEVEQLKALAAQREEEEKQLAKAATLPKTDAEKGKQRMKERRINDSISEAIQFTHRQRMEHFNNHLGSLSEHFDIPKVGPG
mmetsp:Transcript_35294/g.82401  ORF Transcript_35294/g.82401 Transcript_35294/m.82401 type:complete len:126 (-) Transcript_35294:154-531(-)|eukprot:CAMPEP_0178451674 /NCGR_PEP_ID=MMETSP0689_2-20121128/43815_1 /TAXON_ID=160604 /ORGANISM="Amphidinium massartii, Strain CS-259" /LENGTH=125 /DNA_ID=CAMNT_0020077285 /DNA_START=81 /DNA_END=458 /DNA_ORIENTATION=+